jgi:membrane AbrB-like protein
VNPNPRNIAGILFTLIVCAAGASLCVALHTPLPWMIGPLLAMALGQMAGLPLRPVPWGRQIGQVIIATALGLYFTPEVLRQLFHYGALMLLGALLAVGLGFLGAWILHRLTDTDWPTAYFASVPGGAAEMSVLGENFGARVERIALSQSLRLALIVLIVPGAIMASGAHGSDPYQAAILIIDYPKLALLLLLAALGGALLFRLRLPNAWMLGPLFVSMALTLGDLHFSAIPGPFSNTGQLLIGCALGSRFERSFMMSAPRFLAAVLLSVAVALTIAFVCALAFAWVSGLARPTMLLALTPGGIAEICITAKVLQLGVPVVTAFHVVRLVILVTGSSTIFRLLSRPSMS